MRFFAPFRRGGIVAAVALASSLAFAPGAAHAANNPGTGDTGFFTFRPADTVAGTQINVASGNALIRTRDLADGLLTYHVVVDRAYNSLAPNDFSILSPRWKFDVGPDTKLTVESNQDATVAGPSGYRVRFERQSDGSYDPPTGFDGTLTKTVNGWTLIRTSQNDEFGFDNNGSLTWTKDSEARDFTIQGTSAAGRTVLSSYGTNSGRRVNLSYNGDSLVRLMDDPASGHHSYRYTAGRLTEYESPTGAKTTYGYDSNGFLDEIVEPGGTTVELDVLSSGKINSITTTLPGGVPQTTGFVYTRRTYKSDAIAPDGVRRTYAYDDDWRVTRQYNPDEVPEVSASGELKDLESGYVGPNRTYPVTVAATQPDGAGLRRLWLTLVPENELVGENVPCTTTPFDLACPQTYDAPLNIDFGPLPEGPTTVRGAALDDEQNRGNSIPWQVTVDKTAPTTIAASGDLFNVRNSYINGQGIKSVTASAVDPSMADGTRLSGLKRLQLEHVGHGIIATSDVSCTALACPVSASEALNVDTALFSEGAHQLRILATDLVGNTAASDAWTIRIDRTAPTTPAQLRADYDPSRGETQISWGSADPVLSDGSPGAGVVDAQYRLRNGGTWGSWTDADAVTHSFIEALAGGVITFQVSVSDGAGNEAVSPEVTTTTSGGPPPIEDSSYFGACPSQTTAAWVLCDGYGPAQSGGSSAPQGATPQSILPSAIGPNAAVPNAGRCEQGPLPSGDPRPDITDYIFRQNRSWQGIQGGTPDPSGYIPVGGNRVNIVNDQAAVSMNGRSAIVRVAQEVRCGPGVRPNISVAFKDTQGRVRDSLAFAQGSYDISYRPDRQRMYLHGSVYKIIFRYTFKSPFHYGLNTVRSSRFETPWLRCPSNGRCKFDSTYRAP